MAYDVAAAAQHPNYLATAQNAYKFGTAQRLQREEEEAQNEFRNLTEQSIAGDLAAQDRQVALDPERAAKVQQAGAVRMEQLRGGMDFLKKAVDSGDPAHIAAAENAVGPYLSRITGKPYQPGSFSTPEGVAAFQQAYAKIAMAGPGKGNGEVFAQKIGEDGFIYNAMRDGTMVNTGVKADRQTWFANNPGVDPYLVREGGSIVPIGAPAGPAPTQQPQTSTAVSGGDPKADAIVAAANAMKLSGVPDEQVEAFMAQAFAASPGMQVTGGGSGNQLATPDVIVPSPNLRRPSAAEDAAAAAEAKARVEAEYAPGTAAAVERAKLETQIDLAPEQAAADANRAGAIKVAESDAERTAATNKRVAQAAETVTILQDAIALLPEATGGLAGQVRDAAGRAVNQSTEGSRATARLKLLGAKLVANVPRFEGPQSNIDVQFYREAAGDLANPDLSTGERMAAAELMLEIAQRYATPTEAAPPPAAAEDDIADLLQLYGSE